MYVKVHVQILDSSLAEDYETRHIFMDLLLLCDLDGVLDLTLEAIARRINVPLEIVKRAIEKLERPDPRSRSAEHEGRRIIRLDEQREWGWRIVNFLYYRSLINEADKREKGRLRQQNFRAKHTATSGAAPVTHSAAAVTPCNGPVTPGSACNDMQKQNQKHIQRQGAESAAPASVQGISSNLCPELLTKEEALAQAFNAGVPKDFALYVYDDWASRGGKDGAGVACDFAALCKKRWNRERPEWERGTHRGNVANTGRGAQPARKLSAFEIKERLAAIDEELGTLKRAAKEGRNANGTGVIQIYTPEQEAARNTLLKNRVTLKHMLTEVPA